MQGNCKLKLTSCQATFFRIGPELVKANKGTKTVTETPIGGGAWSRPLMELLTGASIAASFDLLSVQNYTNVDDTQNSFPLCQMH